MFTEEDLEAEALLVKDGDQEPVIMNRLQAQLYALASDPATFLSDPDPDDQVRFFFQNYQKWKKIEFCSGNSSKLFFPNFPIFRDFLFQT